MGLKTIPRYEIEEKTENMYEAVSAMSQQAKIESRDRIVAKAIVEHQEEGDEDIDVFDEIEVRFRGLRGKRKSNKCCNK